MKGEGKKIRYKVIRVGSIAYMCLLDESYNRYITSKELLVRQIRFVG